MSQLFHNYSLPHWVVKQISQEWNVSLKIDAFADDTNKKLKRYWSWKIDPRAERTDAFQQAWPRKGLFLHPPWKLIPQVLKKINQDRVQDCVMVTPTWPTQYWWPMVLKRNKAQPLVFNLKKNFSVTVWRLSGCTRRKNGWMKLLQSF
ncbi:hypothetical protein G6F70_009599 [Rhizopus microsporus]|nr:hypothetical protein G6F70_009599 [Rhizopus microsporus]KAG1223357.1 hypothetical protein G6F67_009649 [Rhizopus microsporus]